MDWSPTRCLTRRISSRPMPRCLMFLRHRKIGKIAAVAEVGQRAGDADQPAIEVCADHEVGVREHFLQAGKIVHRAVDAGRAEQCGELGRRERGRFHVGDLE